jgi:lipoyl-dependent peroxiredoxin
MNTDAPAQDSPELPTPVAATLAQIAERIRVLRVERGFRLVDLAALTGLSEAHLYRLEQGERWPSVPALLTLASVYGVEASLLLSGPSRPQRVALHRSGATWEGQEETGSGVMVNHAVSVSYNRESRLTSTDAYDPGSEVAGSPEELIGMAFAGCFSMSLAQQLNAAGFEPRRIEASAEIRLGVSSDQAAITEIRLGCEADVVDIDDARFQEIAQITKRTCVIARALMAVPVTLDAHLVVLPPTDQRRA